MDILDSDEFYNLLDEYGDTGELENLKHWLRTNRDSIKTPAELSAITGQSDFT